MSNFEEFKQNISSRLRDFIHSEKMSQVDFANHVGVKRPSLSAVLSRGGGVSAELVYKIIKKYPTLNWNWMYKGTGGMIEESTAVYIDGTLVAGGNIEDGNINYGKNEGVMEMKKYIDNYGDKTDLLELEIKYLKEQLLLKDELITLLREKK